MLFTQLLQRSLTQEMEREGETGDKDYLTSLRRPIRFTICPLQGCPGAKTVMKISLCPNKNLKNR